MTTTKDTAEIVKLKIKRSEKQVQVEYDMKSPIKKKEQTTGRGAKRQIPSKGS